MCERTVFVSGLPGDTRTQDLHIYFQSKKKSNRGDVEDIDYNPGTGIAKLLFADSQVAKSVANRQHKLRGCTLTVKMSNDQEEDMSSSVLVRGISDNTTEDALQNYFENKRRSSGGDVKEIKRVNNGQAVVTFESPEIAKRVLEWGKHTLDDHPLTVTKIKPDPPKKTASYSAGVPVTEEKSHTVKVTGISPKTTKDALLNFFENKRRSGGGEIEDIQYYQDEGFAEITFCSAEDAENASQKEGLQLVGAKLGLALKEIPKVLPKDPYKLHVIGLSEKTTIDGFLSFIEVVSGEEVNNMLFGSNSNVMVTFQEPPDLEKIQQKCRKRPLDGSHLQIEQVSICDCIEVSGLGSKTTRDTILYYFENPRKSGGGDVKKIEYVDGETKALVFFEEPSVVARVVVHEHVIYGNTLQVVPHYPSREPSNGQLESEQQLHADTRGQLQNERLLHEYTRRQFEIEQQQHAETRGQLESEQEGHRHTQEQLVTSQTALQLAESSQRDWILDRSEIEMTATVLGAGGWGSVREGRFRGTVVAVKQIYSILNLSSEYYRRLFQREMQMAARCRHPYLLQFIGATNDNESPLFVTELLETSLRAILEKRRELEPNEVTTISLDVARALNYLHLNRPTPIIHRDISSANVLLWKQGESWRAKVSDYGTANFMHHCQTIGPGAVVYSAPEARTSRQTVKIDVFSYGVLLLEIHTREFPDPSRRNGQITMVTNKSLKSLITRCLAEDPNERPSMAEIISFFENS